MDLENRVRKKVPEYLMEILNYVSFDTRSFAHNMQDMQEFRGLTKALLKNWI